MQPSIIGVGMTKFGRYPDRSVESIAAEAICRALDDAGVEWGDVQQVYAAHVQQGVAAGQRVMREMGATGVPVLNAKWGERVIAAIVLRPGTHATEEELIGWCRKSLAGYKKPSQVWMVDQLPKSGIGKVLRREIKQQFLVG